MIKAMLNFKCGMGRLCVCVCRRREGGRQGKGRWQGERWGEGGRGAGGPGPGPGWTGSGPVYTSWFWPGAGHYKLPHLSFLLRNENHGSHLLRRHGDASTSAPGTEKMPSSGPVLPRASSSEWRTWVPTPSPESQTASHTEDTFAAWLCSSPQIFFKCLHHRTSCLFWTFWCF